MGYDAGGIRCVSGIPWVSGRMAGVGARETARPDLHHAVLPARDPYHLSAVACDVPCVACDVLGVACDVPGVTYDVPGVARDVSVVTIMVVVPPCVMAGVEGARMAP